MLQGKGYSAFLPLQRQRRFYGERSRHVELPLFAGYVFCRFDVSDRLPVLTTPGIIHIVGNGGVPVPVEDQEIESLQRVNAAELAAEPCHFRLGERVTIAQGALAGVEGVLLCEKNSCRLVLSVTLLQRSVQVEIDREWVNHGDGAAARDRR